LFTGLIREIGTIRSLSPQRGVMRLRLAAPQCAPHLQLGDSLAVNGICLTVTQCRGQTVTVEAAAETRRVTTLRRWRAGQRVHLEPALAAGEPLGGHLVLGHVDGTGQLLRRDRSGKSVFLTFAFPPALAGYLLPKGSVAVDGVSLTLDSGPFRDRFTVNVVPYTLTRTRLGELRPGERVNLEMDVLVKAARDSSSAEEAGNAAAAPAGKTSMSLTELFTHGYQRRYRR
jgi:riboflavin synthase